MRKNQYLTVFRLGLVILIAALSIAANPLSKKHSNTRLEFDPENFVDEVNNPYFPLDPGTTYFYEGEAEGVPISEEVFVTRDTKVILGVTTTVVHALSYEDGVLIEETFDWYAQDVDGNVWYFGEDTRELDENGNVISTEGAWEAGVNGAEPGIIMLADPKKGDRYQQELALDVAEDMAQVIGFEDSVCVEYGCFDNVLVTKEWTPLERGVVEEKYYAEGVGFIYSEMTKGGEETLELVRVRP